MRAWIRLVVDLQPAENSPDARRPSQRLLGKIAINSGQSQPPVAAFKTIATIATIAGFRNPDAPRIAGSCNTLFWKPMSRVRRIAFTYVKRAIILKASLTSDRTLTEIKVRCWGLCT
jgi:hypothetical protein